MCLKTDFSFRFLGCVITCTLCSAYALWIIIRSMRFLCVFQWAEVFVIISLLFHIVNQRVLSLYPVHISQFRLLHGEYYVTLRLLPRILSK